MSKSTNPQLSERLALANAEDTPAEMLKKLGSDPSKNVRMAVAANPNTPEDVLLKLGQKFPDIVVDNPIFGILLLEKPDSEFVRLSLARSSKTSVETLTALAQIPDFRLLCTIAENPKTPSSVLGEVVQHSRNNLDYYDREFYKFEQICYVAAKNPNIPLKALITLAEKDDGQMRNAIAQNPNAPAFLLEKMVINNLDAIDEELFKQLHSHPNTTETILQYMDFLEEKPGTSPELLESLAKHQSSYVRQLVADHPRTPPHVLDALASDNETSVVNTLLENPQTTTDTLEKLTRNLAVKEFAKSERFLPYCHASEKIVRHVNVSPKILEILTDYTLPRYSIARLSSALPSLLRQVLAKAEIEKDVVLWELLVHNPNTPADVLDILFTTIERKQTQKTLKFLAPLLKHPNTPAHLLEKVAFNGGVPELLQAIAQNSSTSTKTLVSMAKICTNSLILRNIAANPNTPIEVLNQFAASPSLLVRSGVASNPVAPLQILERLSADEKSNVRAEVAQNQGIPLSMIEHLATDPDLAVQHALLKNPKTSQAVLEKFFDSTNEKVCVDLARHPNTPTEIVEQLAGSLAKTVRLTVIQRSDLNEKILEIAAEITFDLIEEYNVDDHDILAEIAKHPQTPVQLLYFLATHKHGSISEIDGDMIYHCNTLKPFRLVARRRLKAMS
jgi:hypothetical protein